MAVGVLKAADMHQDSRECFTRLCVPTAEEAEDHLAEIFSTRCSKALEAQLKTKELTVMFVHEYTL